MGTRPVLFAFAVAAFRMLGFADDLHKLAFTMQAVGSTLVVVMLVSARAESVAVLVVPWRCVPVLPW
jgi:hypothetical protein